MIQANEITAAGIFTKTHGLKGELNALLDIDAEFFDFDPCFIIDVDGIFVPFFVESFRPKGEKATLIKPDGVESEPEAKLFLDKTIYINKRSLAEYEHHTDENGEPGGYADDFVGYHILTPEGTDLGEITHVETSTANALFVLRTPDDDTLYVPVADEFVLDIDEQARTIVMQLPHGLVELNKN